MMRYLLAILLVLTLAMPAEARRRGRSYSTVSAAPLAERIDPNLQAIAQRRADAMAAHNSLDHNIHGWTDAPAWHWQGVAGEGIGMGTGEPKQIATCVVTSLVIADAWATSKNGYVFRVRLFG